MANQSRERVALVTGGARGIGLAVARHLVANDYRVAIVDVDEEGLERGAAQLGERGSVLAVRADVSDESEVARAVAEAVEQLGIISALVNNAGHSDPDNGPVESLEIERWNQILATNLTGPLLCAKHCATHLRQAGGAVVNIASTRAMMSEPHTEAYAASKGGLLALTHALAISLGPEVRVNAISPGWIDVSHEQHDPATVAELRPIDHQQHPVGRVGRPDDIARAVEYLLSDRAEFVTGHNLVVDGGMTRKMIYAE